MSNYVKFKPNEIKISTKNGSTKDEWHQYGGVMVYSFKVDKKLDTLGFSDSKYFSTEWWYKCYYREDKKGEYVVSIPEHYYMPESKLRIHPDKLYLQTNLKEILESELNKINSNYQNFTVTGKVTEALLFVDFDYKGKRQSGYVLWENCD